MSFRGRGRGRGGRSSGPSSDEKDAAKLRVAREASEVDSKTTSLVWKGRAGLTDDEDVANDDTAAASWRQFNIVLTQHSLHWYAGKTLALLGPVCQPSSLQQACPHHAVLIIPHVLMQ